MSATRHPIISASLWMVGALVSFVLMAVSVREVSAVLGTFQILFFRSLIGLLILMVLLNRSGWNQLVTPNLWLQLLRNITHFGGQVGWVYGIALIPFAAVFAIEFTVPIWTALFGFFLASERVTPIRLTAISLGLAGVLIILRPGATVVHPAAIAVVLAAISFALTHIMTKKLGKQDSPITILFYMSAIQLPLGLIPAIGSWVTPKPQLWPWIAVIGVAGLTAHYCLVKALAMADATVVIPMDFLRLPVIGLVGFIFYSERVDWFLLLGATLILSGNFINIRTEHRLTPHQPDIALHPTGSASE